MIGILTTAVMRAPAIGIGIVILWASVPALATSPAQTQQRIVQAVAAQKAAGSAVAAWDTQRDQLLADIERLNIQIKYLDHQISQYAAYTARRQAEIERLTHRATAVDAMNLELAPFLSETAQRLAQFIDQDLPFLPAERRERMQRLEQDLNDYTLSLDEKLRRVLETLTVEVQYGHATDTGTATIAIENTLHQVQTLRLGRIAQYYRTPDGHAVGLRTPSAPAWRPLPPADARPIGMAMEMADRNRIIDLVVLPVGRPTPLENAPMPTVAP